MRACGVKVVPDVDLSLRVLQNRELLVKIVPDTFQGQARARVRSYRPLRPKEGAPVSEADESGSTPF